MNYRDELIAIAKAYCKKNGFEYLFVNDSDFTFGYETPEGCLVHRSFWDMAEELGMEV